MSLIGFIGPETEKITQGQKIFAIFCEPALYSPEARVEKGKNFSKFPLKDGGFSNAIYPVIFYDPVLGRVTCRCRLSAALPLRGGELCSLRCTVLEQLAQENRRQDVKIPLNMSVMLHTAYHPGDQTRTPNSGVPATIMNISAGGVYLRTTALIPKGRRVWFDFQAPTERFTLSAQILRVENASSPQSRDQGFYGYGCKFVDLLSRHEAALRSYIFQEERRQRQQQKDR